MKLDFWVEDFYRYPMVLFCGTQIVARFVVQYNFKLCVKNDI